MKWERVTHRSCRINTKIWEQSWFYALSEPCKLGYFRLYTSCDVLGIASLKDVPVPGALAGALTQVGAALVQDGYILLCDYIKSQGYVKHDISTAVYAFAECPLTELKTYLAERYDDLFTQERLDKYDRGVLLRDLHMPYSAWRELRRQVFRRDNYTCRYCGRHVEGEVHCDHVIPLSRGGKTELDNLVTACPACNLSKHNKTPDEWKANKEMTA